MSKFAHRLICLLGFLLILGVPLRAQENLDLGKTPAQLYASGCAICHKSSKGLAAKGGGILGLESFLRQHYTASRESAAAIAGYLRSIDSGPAAAPGRAVKRPPKSSTPKGDDKAKGAEKKPDTSKSGEAKSGDGKPADSKASEPKPAEPKSEPKPAEAKPSEPKPAEAKPAEPKPAEGGKPN